MGPRGKHHLKIIVGLAGGFVAMAGALLIIASVYISRHARDLVITYLTAEFKSEVDLSKLSVTIPFPLVQLEGDNLVLHFKGRTDLPPMFAIKHFTVRTDLLGLLRSPREVGFVHLDGLQITIPPREDRSTGDTASIGKAAKKFRSVRINQILSHDATLTILTKKPGKKPLEFDIQELALHATGPDIQMAFHTTLTNPAPPGEIVSDGNFGPWNADTPSATPVSGKYTFDNADLGVFRGIAGILSSKGEYKGVLEKLETKGTTDTPDFRVTRAGHPVHLSTSFQATVDGTNGDTYLHPVETHFGKTILIAQGSVEGMLGKKGKTITLDVTGNQARIEDLLLFAMKEEPSMTGPVRLKTKFVLIPGPREIPDRLNLNGSFELDSVHFTNSVVQQKIDNMSKRSQGEPKEVEDIHSGDSSDDVATAMRGDFRLREGILNLLNFGFQMPGTYVRLDGTYNLPQEDLDLHGTVEMQAKLSQMVTGFKSVLLKAVDPFFSKKGKGTVLHIKITGPVKHPHYGLDHGYRQGKDTDEASKK